MRPIFEILLSFSLFLFYPSLSQETFLFTAPIMTWMARKQEKMAMWALLILSLLQSSIAPLGEDTLLHKMFSLPIILILSLIFVQRITSNFSLERLGISFSVYSALSIGFLIYSPTILSYTRSLLISAAIVIAIYSISWFLIFVRKFISSTNKGLH